MKYKYLLTICLSVLTLVGCNNLPEDNTPEAPDQNLGDSKLWLSNLNMKDGGSGDLRVVTMSSSRDWKVVIQDSDTAWLSVTPNQGKGAIGDIQVEVRIKPNFDQPQNRLASVRFEQMAPDSLFESIKIEQKSACYLHSDSLVLVSFFDKMGGENWDTKWDRSLPINKWGKKVQTNLGESWDGVWTDIIDGQRRVTLIWYWFKNNIVGQLPEELGQLDELISFGFSRDPGITGPIPFKALANCKNFDRISATGCGITGTLTKDLSNLKKLTVIELNGNNLTGIEDGALNLPILQALLINGNKVSGPLKGEWFLDMPNVLFLDLGGNNFEGEIPKNIMEKKKRLQVLTLSGNRFTGVFPDAVRYGSTWEFSGGPQAYCPQQDGFGFFPGSCE